MDGAADKAAELAERLRRRERDMSIYLNKDSKVIVQGMTGSEGSKHTTLMLDAGTNIVGGVNARKAGTTVELGGTDAAGLRLASRRRWPRPAPTCRSSSCRRRSPRTPCIEAIDAGIGLLVVDHRGRAGAGHRRVLGLRRRQRARPGSSARTAPASSPRASRNAGIIPADIAGTGPIGLVSKSGTLTYQMMYELRDFGFSTAIGIGGDPIIGTTHIDALEAFEADPDTEAIVMIGEIGGDAEERAAAYIKDHVTKPVVGYVAGFTAPEGKTMGHAGAIVSGSSGTAAGQEGGPRGGRRQGRQDAVRDAPADARGVRRPRARISGSRTIGKRPVGDAVPGPSVSVAISRMSPLGSRIER